MDDFESLWQEEVEDQAITKNYNEETPEYQIRDGIAKYKILANMIMFYFHAKYGEKMISNTFDPQMEDTQINFYLKK
jgi:hypothetical protein